MFLCVQFKNRAKVQHYKKRARTVLHLFNIWLHIQKPCQTFVKSVKEW